MLLDNNSAPLPLFDTALIHADAAVDFALEVLPTTQAAE
jgi:aspartate/glutamate racemase